MRKISLLFFMSIFMSSYLRAQCDVDLEAKDDYDQSGLVGAWEGAVQTSAKENLACNLYIFRQNLSGTADGNGLGAIVKFNLGGHGTSEYDSDYLGTLIKEGNAMEYSFVQDGGNIELHFNFDKKGALHQLKGKVWVKSAGKHYDMVLSKVPEIESDRLTPMQENWVPSLAGDYFGKCAGHSALLNIMTVRGAEIVPFVAGNLRDYSIMASLGIKDPKLCSRSTPGGEAPWCLIKHYTSSTYGVFSGKLILKSSLNNANCHREDGQFLNCKLTIESKIHDCRFKKNFTEIAESRRFKAIFFPKRVHEKNENLSEDLSTRSKQTDGIFRGYLHYEERDVYQALALAIHVQSLDGDVLNFSADSYFYLGDPKDDLFIGRPFDFQHIGLSHQTLLDNDVDSIFTIDEWQTEHVKGVAYSRAYGRIGAFELTKGDSFPPLDSRAQLMPTVLASYKASASPTLCKNAKWDFDIQPLEQYSRDDFPFQGLVSIQSPGRSMIRKIDRGSYDPHSGAIGFKVRDGEDLLRLVSGKVISSTEMSLYWSTSSVWASVLETWCRRTYLKQ